MKTKILPLLIILPLIISSVKAQTKGQYMLGGNLSYFETGSGHTFAPDIEIGKFLKSNFVTGLMGGYAASKQANDSLAAHSFTIGAFIRQYYALGKRFNLFYELNASYQHYRNTWTYFYKEGTTFRSKSDGGMLNFIPGVSYSITNHLLGELTLPNVASISYNLYRPVVKPQGSDPKQHDFYFDANMNPSILSNLAIGFRVLFGK